MRIVDNPQYVARRAKYANILPAAAILFLVASLVLYAINPVWVGVAVLLGIIGFILSVSGTYFVERFGTQTAHHVKVTEALKGLDDDYTLFIYTLPAPFVLLDPGGLTAILVKTHSGEITYAGGKWQHRQRGKFFRQWGGQESLGQPDKQAEDLAEHLQKRLRKYLPAGLEVPVRPLVLFADAKVQLEAESAPVPTLRAAKFKAWLRGPGKRPGLPAETRRQLEQALGLRAG